MVILHRLIVFVLVLNFQCVLIKCNNCITTQESPGDNKGLPCIFPFNLDDKSYNECTTESDPNEKLWCATETKSDNQMESGKWGYCPDDNNACRERYVFVYKL